LKFQQNQAAFKEQIALLEQIKAKQLDLERMQKLQYAQEKKLLRQKASLKKLEKCKKPTTEETSAEKEPKEDDTLSSESISLDDDSSEEKKQPVSNRSNDEKPPQNTTRSADESTSRGTVSAAQNTPVNPTHNKFLKNMEERSKLREQMKREREEKKRQAEMQRLELIKAQQEEKLRIEEEEKRKKNEELREKRKAQQLIEDKRKLEKSKEQEAISKADQFYKRHLLRYYGLNGLKRLVEIRDEKMQIAEKHYSLVIFKKLFKPWRSITRAELSVLEIKADNFYAKFLLKNYFYNGIKLFKQHAQIEAAKATRFYRFRIKIKLFSAWQVYTAHEKKKFASHESLVREHNLHRIRTTYFLIWKQFPAEARRLRARQKRIDELRNKVKAIIPDYDPASSTGTTSNAAVSLTSTIS
jgi:hypothetical protein